jgi:hypothetical protein
MAASELEIDATLGGTLDEMRHEETEVEPN